MPMVSLRAEFLLGTNSDELYINRSSQIRFCYLCSWQLSGHTEALLTFLQSANKAQHLSADCGWVPSGSSIIPDFSFKHFPSNPPFSTTSRKEGINTMRNQRSWGLSGILNPLWRKKKKVIVLACHCIGVSCISEIQLLWLILQKSIFPTLPVHEYHMENLDLSSNAEEIGIFQLLRMKMSVV